MAEFSRMRALEVWYASLDMETAIPQIKNLETRKRFRKRLAKARSQSVVEHDFPKLAETTSESVTIKENPPLIYHWQDLGKEEYIANIRKAFARYRDTLPLER